MANPKRGGEKRKGLAEGLLQGKRSLTEERNEIGVLPPFNISVGNVVVRRGHDLLSVLENGQRLARNPL